MRVVSEDDPPVARLTAGGRRMTSPRPPGSQRGSVPSLAPDFEAPRDDFKEYRE
jgi:hypothetical protein